MADGALGLSAFAVAECVHLLQPDAPGWAQGMVPGESWPDIGDWQIGH